MLPVSLVPPVLPNLRLISKIDMEQTSSLWHYKSIKRVKSITSNNFNITSRNNSTSKYKRYFNSQCVFHFFGVKKNNSGCNLMQNNPLSRSEMSVPQHILIECLLFRSSLKCRFQIERVFQFWKKDKSWFLRLSRKDSCVSDRGLFCSPSSSPSRPTWSSASSSSRSSPENP